MLSQKIYCIMNDKGAFICKGNRVSKTLTKTDLKKITFYKSKVIADNALQDKDYWLIRGINPDTLIVVECELTLSVLRRSGIDEGVKK